MSTPPALITDESQSGLAEDAEATTEVVEVVEIVEDNSDGLPGPDACEEGEDGDSDDTKSDDASSRGGRRRGGRRKGRTESPDEPPRPPIVPKVRRTGYEGFKNYYNEEESLYAIEVLEAGYNIKEEVLKEKLRRGGHGGKLRTVPTIKSTQGVGTVTDEIWIQRVRIQSSYILAHLRSIMTSVIKWDRVRTFHRPFHAFIHYQPRVKEALEELRLAVAEKKDNPKSPIEQSEHEKEAADKFRDRRRRDRRRSSDRKRAASVSSVSSRSGSDSDSGSESDDNADAEVPDEYLYSEEAIEHLQCYVDFVDKNIMHLADLYKGTSKQRIRYSDLSYLFHPGDVVYSPTQAELQGTTNHPTAKPSPAVYQPIWKIQYTNPPSISDTCPEEYDKSHRFYISCFYIDFDGNTYGPVKYRFDIVPYEGEREIKSLPVYPIRYHNTISKGTNSHGSERLRPAGKDFQTYVQARHLYYRGWTLTTSPNGDTLTDNAGDHMTHPEHIDSNVIVDFKAALQALPSWKPTFKDPSQMDEEWTTGADDYVPITQWSDSKRSRVVRRIIETTQMRDGAHAIETNTHADTDPFLVAYMAGNTDTDYELSEENLQLLPGRVMAYVLRDRKFVQLDVHYLSKIEQQSNVFENLKIDDQHKSMVMALVDSHFRKKESKGPRHFSLGQDLIQGKGEGLVILLHGVPGVGKTATAEAVAQSNQQPLFVITCGDLGFTPKEVERSLEEIFRLAHLWDCILLLDEADIFLAERTRDDLKRNALVSVFLRVLEYYSGILFLTTNRVGTLDEAFKSRIHMSLYYPPLNREQTMQIFQMNIERIEEIDRKRRELRLRDRDASERRKDEKKGKEKEKDKGITSRASENGDARENERDYGRRHDERDDLAHHLIVDRESVMDFALKHYNDNKQGRWNGRQIRNAFQIASSLAFYDKRQAWIRRQKENKDNSGSTHPVPDIGAAVLSDDQFKKVANATLKFEKYMTDARGADDRYLARVDRLRADDHVANEEAEYKGSSQRHDRDPEQERERESLALARRSDNGGSSRRFGGPPSPYPQTPQSGRRGGDDDYDRSRRDDRGYDTVGRYDDRARDRDYDRDRDRDYDRDRDRDYGRDRDRDYNGGGSGRGGAVQDFRRRNDDYDVGYSPRSNAGYDRDRPYDDRDRDHDRDRDRGIGSYRDGRNDRDRGYDRDRGLAPSSSVRSRRGGSDSGDFDKRVHNRNQDRTPTRSERGGRDREGNRDRDWGRDRDRDLDRDREHDTPTVDASPSASRSARDGREGSPDRGRLPQEDIDLPAKYRGTADPGPSSYQSPPPSTGTPRGGSRDY